MKPFCIPAMLWAAAFLVYQTTFAWTPRLFLYPRAGLYSFDVADHAAALKGAPNETDMRKHLLYYPVGRALYRQANLLRLRLGINHDAAALLFPGALYGATSLVLAYRIFLAFMKETRAAAASAAFYAFTYSVWLAASVTESYALTTLSVNAFFFCALAGEVEPGRRRLLAATALVALSSLCDMRSLLLLIVPSYVIARARGMKRSRRIGAALFMAAGTAALVAAAYKAYSAFSGHEGLGISAVCGWLPGYGWRFASSGGLSDLTSAGRVLLAFFLESISPVYQEPLERCSAPVIAAHICLVSCFLGFSAVLVAGAIRDICVRLRSSVLLQGLACWVVAYTLFHLFFSPSTAMLFSPPVVMPWLLIVLPGIAGVWGRRRSGAAMVSAVVAVVLANNLLVLNEARLAWREPGVVLSPADRCYVLPGEIERLHFLDGKGVPMLPGAQRERLAELRAKLRAASWGALTESERGELDGLMSGALNLLPGPEREEAFEIFRRVKAVWGLAEGQR